MIMALSAAWMLFLLFFVKPYVSLWVFLIVVAVGLVPIASLDRIIVAGQVTSGSVTHVRKDVVL